MASGRFDLLKVVWKKVPKIFPKWCFSDDLIWLYKQKITRKGSTQISIQFFPSPNCNSYFHMENAIIPSSIKPSPYWRVTELRSYRGDNNPVEKQPLNNSWCCYWFASFQTKKSLVKKHMKHRWKICLEGNFYHATICSTDSDVSSPTPLISLLHQNHAPPHGRNRSVLSGIDLSTRICLRAIAAWSRLLPPTAPAP